MDARTCEGPPDVNSYMHMLTSVSEDSWGKLRHVIGTLMQCLAGTMGTLFGYHVSCQQSITPSICPRWRETFGKVKSPGQVGCSGQNRVTGNRN